MHSPIVSINFVYVVVYQYLIFEETIQFSFEHSWCDFDCTFKAFHPFVAALWRHDFTTRRVFTKLFLACNSYLYSINVQSIKSMCNKLYYQCIVVGWKQWVVSWKFMKNTVFQRDLSAKYTIIQSHPITTLCLIICKMNKFMNY